MNGKGISSIIASIIIITLIITIALTASAWIVYLFTAYSSGSGINVVHISIEENETSTRLIIIFSNSGNFDDSIDDIKINNHKFISENSSVIPSNTDYEQIIFLNESKNLFKTGEKINYVIIMKSGLTIQGSIIFN
jgi:hypothetical protein